MTLPNFMVIGVAKAGTTSLYRYLDQHPQIYMCSDKGTNYFGYEDARSWRWTDEGDAPLLQHFPIRTRQAYEALFSGVRDEIAIGEVSPQYFRCPTAARRIHDCIPSARLVASLRNPAERAFSGFLMRTRRGERVDNASIELTIKSGHVKEGFYFARLKRFFDTFPRHQIKILIFEEFKRDPARAMQDLYEFLDVDSTFVPDTSTRHNPAAVPKIRLINRLFYDPTLIRITKSILPEPVQAAAKQIQQQNLKTAPRLPADLRSDLLELYREDILRLESLLDRDLSIWRDGI